MLLHTSSMLTGDDDVAGLPQEMTSLQNNLEKHNMWDIKWWLVCSWEDQDEIHVFQGKESKNVSSKHLLDTNANVKSGSSVQNSYIHSRPFA